MEIKIFLLNTGKTIISRVGLAETGVEDFYYIFNPYVITKDQSETQQPLIPYGSASSEEGIKLFKRSIVAECTPSDAVKKSYAELFSN